MSEERKRFAARDTPVETAAKSDPTQDIVRAMIELSRDATTITEAGREHFFAEPDGRLMRHAADAIVVKFHELCERLPESTRAKHPAVPWQDIRGIRNRLSHHYRETDYRIIWATITRDLVDVVEDMRTELAK